MDFFRRGEKRPTAFDHARILVPLLGDPRSTTRRSRSPRCCSPGARASRSRCSTSSRSRSSGTSTPRTRRRSPARTRSWRAPRRSWPSRAFRPAPAPSRRAPPAGHRGRRERARRRPHRHGASLQEAIRRTMGRGTHRPVRHAQLDRAGVVPARRDEGAGTHAMRVIIVGCGRVGARVAAELDQRGEHVTVIDINPRAFSRLPQSFGGETVRGNGTDEDIMRSAGAEQADIVMTLTEGDNRNALAAQLGEASVRRAAGHRQDQRPAARRGVPRARPRDDLPHDHPRRRPGRGGRRGRGGDERLRRAADRPAAARRATARLAGRPRRRRPRGRARTATGGGDRRPARRRPRRRLCRCTSWSSAAATSATT